MIDSFCLKFYQRLFANVLTLDQAFKNTYTECFDSHFNTMILKCMEFNKELIYDELLEEGPKLLPFKTMVH